MRHSQRFFINRRSADRRREHDPCRHLPLDLYHRKRRKSTDRRAPGRSLEQDYYAFYQDPDLPSNH